VLASNLVYLNKAVQKFFFPTRSSLGVVFLLFGIAIGLVVRFLAHWLFDYKMGVGDTAYYLQMADNIANYSTFGEGPERTVYRPPLYSFFLACLHWIFGQTGRMTVWARKI